MSKRATRKAQQSETSRAKSHSAAGSPSGMISRVDVLQRSIGNQAVVKLFRNIMTDQPPGVRSSEPKQPLTQTREGEDKRAELFRQAAASTGAPVEFNIRQTMEQQLNVPLSHVRVHQGPASHAAAASISARAFALGSNIHLGADVPGADGEKRRELLAHEIVHTVQQGGRPVPLEGRIPVSSPHDPAETEARQVAAAATTEPSIASASPALGLRNSMRATSVAPSIQRDIKGDKTFGTGKFEVNFTKNEAAAAGGQATEDGTVTFTPSATAPESNSIRFVQIVRTIDVSGATGAAGADVDWSKVGGGGEAPRNAQITKRNAKKNIAPGFYVDQQAAIFAKRTKKADPDVLPYYDAQFRNPGNQIGKRKGKVITAAILADRPGSNIPIKFNFVTSAKAADTGTWYGTVLWGFELFNDKKGIAKIKNEYRSFRTIRGATTDAALNKFNEFYQNPGSTTAPKK